MSESNDVDLALEAFHTDKNEARALIMKWAVATVALQDIVNDRKDSRPSWPDLAQAATKWLEDYGKSEGKWKSHQEVSLRISTMGGEPEPVPQTRLEQFDEKLSLWMQRYGVLSLRWSLGIVFVWFGALKPFGLSPAAGLVEKTVTWFPFDYFFPILGVWEVAIGLCLMFRPLLRVALVLLFLQMPGTALPLLLLPDICFTHFPYALTLEGQYIIKNLTLISAGIMVGGTVRMGKKRRDQRRVTWVL